MKKFDNYVSNLAVLTTAEREDLGNEFIISGIIDKFYIQFELGWKVLKELLKFEGRTEARSGSPREIIKTAFAVYDFIDEETWLAMLRDRNNTTHIYDAAAAQELARNILKNYIPAFLAVQRAILEKYGGQLAEM